PCLLRLRLQPRLNQGVLLLARRSPVLREVSAPDPGHQRRPHLVAQSVLGQPGGPPLSAARGLAQGGRPRSRRAPGGGGACEAGPGRDVAGLAVAGGREDTPVADGLDHALLGPLLGRVRKDDAALRVLLPLARLDHAAIAEWTQSDTPTAMSPVGRLPPAACG